MAASDPRQAPGFRRRLLAARVTVWAERLWPALWPAVAVVGVFLAASLFGLWYGLSPIPHVLLLVLFLAALGAAVWHARQSFRFSDRQAGLARLERDSGARHQPLRGLDDELPDAVQDPVTQRLWAMHRERLVAGIRQLRLAPPRSFLPVRDPWAFRAALVLVLVVAVTHGWGEIGSRLASAFTLERPSAVAAVPPRLDLWVTPPTYTHRPPLASEQTRGQSALSVPAGSIALAQLHHQAAGAMGGAQLVWARPALPSTSWAAAVPRPGLELRPGCVARGAWSSRAGAGQLVHRRGTRYAAHGGVRGPAAGHAPGRHAPGLRGRRRLRRGRAGPPDLARGPGGGGRAFRPGQAGEPAAQADQRQLPRSDLASAGRPAGRAQARGAGRAGAEGPEPAARDDPAGARVPPSPGQAIIGQRRELARDPATSPDVAGRLAALAESDAAQSLPTTVPLSLRVAAARLSFNQEPGARRDVIDLLWQLALFIEDGALSVAERKLRELQDQIQRALQEGAKDSELERLMDEMQKALDEFLEEMTRQAMQNMQQMDPSQMQQMPEGAQTVERRDLQEMLDKAREMLRSGSKEAAREMLAQLQQMLENLRAGRMQAQQPSQGQQALSDLQKMIQLQQQLLDRSFQMDRQQRQGEQGEQGQEGQQGQQGQRGQQGQPGQQGQSQGGQQPGQQMGQAASEQEALRRALGELMRRLGDAGMEIPRALGQAELEMRNARGALEGAEPGTAAEAQTQAVDSMQRAGQAMMDQLREQMAQQQGQGPGNEPMPQAGRRGRDPLGRSTRNDGGFDTQGVQVPEESDLGRARDVLEELYRRAGEQRRPPAELDYFRRLLDRF